MSSLDWSIIAVYMLASLLVGVYFTKRASSSLSEFFVSGRNIPWWLAGTSMVATSFSADTPLYVTGLVRSHGIYENWQWWCFILSGMLAVSFFARLWSRAGVLTDVELIDIRYSGRSASVLRGFKAVYFSCVIHTIIKAQIILAMAKIMDVTLGWGKWPSILVSSGVTLCYSTLSGFWGVVLTDFMQFTIAMTGAIVLAVVSVHRAGGVGAIKAQLPPDVLSFFPPGEFLGTAFMTFLGYIGLSWWSKYSSDGGGVVVQRITSCRSERDGLIATLYFNITNYALRTWPWVLAALASMVLYSTCADNEAIYPRMVVDLMPTGLKGLMVASFFAAFMSSLATYLNLSSAYFVNDFYRPFIKPGMTDRHYITVSRISTLVLAAITAYVTSQVESIVGVFKFLIAFGSGTGLVYIVRWFWWRVNAWSEISAMLASTFATIYAYKFTELAYYGKLSFIIGVSTSVWVAVTLLTKPVERAKLESFVRHIRPAGRGWATVRHGMVDLPQAESFRGALYEWISGSLFLVAITLGIGKLLLGYYLSGAIWAAIAAISGAATWRSINSVRRVSRP